MQRKDLINAIADNNGISKSEAEKAVAMTLNAIRQSLINGENVIILGFGSFAVKERKEYKGVNPSTKEIITVPAKNIVTFKSSAKFLNK